MAKNNRPKTQNRAAAQAERAARAKAALEEQKRAERRRLLITVGAVVAALVVVVGIGWAFTASRDDSADVDAAAAGQSDYGVTVGDPDAPHQVVIYEDFLCPFCGELEAASNEEFTRLADEGKVFVEYRPFVLLDGIGPYSLAATNAFAVVLEESGPEVAKEFHDLLYADQPAESGPFPDDQWLIDKAVEAGADEADVSAGITGLEQQDWAEAATQQAVDSGVQSTPTVLLDGEPVQAGSVDEIADRVVSAVE